MMMNKITLRHPLRKQLEPYYSRWAFNNSPNDLGIIRFAFDLFPELNRDYGVPNYLRQTMYNVLKYKEGMIKIDRMWAIATARDFAKSTYFAKILPIYLQTVGYYGVFWKNNILPEADYIRVRGKTQDESEKRLDNITFEYRENDFLIHLFGELEPTLKDMKNKKRKNQAKLLMLNNNYILQGQGLNQPARGANIRGRRPKVDINDDVENKENTKSIISREWNAKEILGEQLGGLDKKGLTIYIGNYVHQDCLLANLQKENSGWNRLFFTATYIDEKTGKEKSGWEKRFSVNYFKKLRKFYDKQEKLGRKIFMMEYYNKIVSDEDFSINTWYGEYVRRNDINFLRVYDRKGKARLVRVKIIVSADPAISEKKRTSNATTVVNCFGADGNRYILDIAFGKYDIRDRYYDEDKRPYILALTEEDLENVKRRGLVEEVVRQIILYKADGFVIENAGQQLAWYNDVVDLLRRLDINIPGMPYHPTDEKVYKLRTGLLNIMSAGKYYVKHGLPFASKLLSEIDSFPDSKLDLLDAIHNSEKLYSKPPSTYIKYGKTFNDEKQYKNPIIQKNLSLIEEGADPWILY